MRFPLATSVAASPAIPAARGGRSPAGAAVQGPGLVARVAVRSHASRGRGVASRSGAARPRRAHSARGPWFSLRGAAAGGTGRGGWPSYVEGADVSADRGRSHLRRRTAACQGRAGRRIRVGYRPRRAAASRCAEAVRRAIGARRNRSGRRRLPRAPCPRTGDAATSTKHGVGRGARATNRPRCGEVRPVVRSRPVPACCAGAGAAAGRRASGPGAGSAWVPQQSDGAAGRRRNRSARTAASPRRRHCSGAGLQRSRPPRGTRTSTTAAGQRRRCGALRCLRASRPAAQRGAVLPAQRRCTSERRARRAQYAARCAGRWDERTSGSPGWVPSAAAGNLGPAFRRGGGFHRAGTRGSPGLRRRPLVAEWSEPWQLTARGSMVWQHRSARQRAATIGSVTATLVRRQGIDAPGACAWRRGEWLGGATRLRRGCPESFA